MLCFFDAILLLLLRLYIYHSPNQQRWLLNEPIQSPSVHRARLHHVILILEFLLVFIFSIIFSLSLSYFSFLFLFLGFIGFFTLKQNAFIYMLVFFSLLLLSISYLSSSTLLSLFSLSLSLFTIVFHITTT